MRLDAALDVIAEVPDFPKPGVLFRDLTPLFADGAAFSTVISALADALEPGVDRLAAVEARGFLLAAALGYATGLGVALVRKPGKLPTVASTIDYQLEYGNAALELPAGTVAAGQRVVVVDDVLATGGTVAATCALLERAGATVAGIHVVIELADLPSAAELAKYQVRSLRTC